MIPSELMADLPLPPGHEREARLILRLALRHFRDHIYEATLSTGQRVLDQIDFKCFFEECVEALAPTGKLRQAVCMRCFHVHERDGECGVDLGKGGRCDCKAEVRA